MSDTYHSICREEELTAGQARAEILNGWPILICRTEQGIQAVINRCTHAASELASGRVRRGIVLCPLHGARFDLSTGKCLPPHAHYQPLKKFPVRVVRGLVEVGVPDEKPGLEHIPVRAQAGAAE